MIKPTVNFSGLIVDNVTMSEAIAKADELISTNIPSYIVTPNPELIVASQKDQELKDILNSASLRLPDGISMVVVSKILGDPLKERVAGIDFMIELCSGAAKNGWKVFLLGGGALVAQKAAEKLQIDCPGLEIVGTRDGFFTDAENDDVVLQIRESGADILFVGLGGGKQEKWLYKNLMYLGVKVGMVIGGSMDVISGIKKRAPKWTQTLYIEWLYRLLSEPKRIKRQVALPIFLYLSFFKRRTLGKKDKA